MIIERLARIRPIPSSLGLGDNRDRWSFEGVDCMKTRLVVRGLVVVAMLFTATPGTGSVVAQPAASTFSYPIGLPGQPVGDGFYIRHGYATENTWYLPGYLHTGEDWYAVTGDTAGAMVLAVGAGEVVFVGSNYPGTVVIVQHADDLYSMYGHLDDDLPITMGDVVARGHVLGTVHARTDDRAPSHLHFEIRTFLTTPEVNGADPRYDFACGPDCPPGPGYWPIDAPEHPSAIGWRNPTHVINNEKRAVPNEIGEVIVASEPPASSLRLWSRPDTSTGSKEHATISASPGERFPLVTIHTGPVASDETSANGYVLWYEIRLSEGGTGWVQAVVPDSFETGSDGRPSTSRFALYPALSSS